MSYTAGDDGRYSIPLVDFGTRLRDNFGLNIGEHSAFGGNTGGHSANSYHNYDEAIDITDHRSDNLGGVHWTNRTANLRKLLAGAGPEVLGPDNDAGHKEHVHLAATGGNLSLSQQQYDYFFGGNSGGKEATFASVSLPSATQPPVEGNRPAAKEKAVAYKDMSSSQMNAAYDKLRAGDDQNKAAIEGMKMHKAHFRK